MNGPLGPPKRTAAVPVKVVWTPVPGKPWLERSNDTPPRMRTVSHPLDKGYRP